MELKLNLQIENLYGGDGNIRTEEIRTIKLERKKGKKTTKSSTGVSSENSVGEEQYEIKQDEINTFKLDEKGNPTYRMGGVHGKLWGHLKASGKMLADLGVEGFDSKAFVDRMMMAVNITPAVISITDYEEMKVDVIPQILNTIGNSMRFFKYDYIPKCRIEVKLTFPDMYKDRVFRMLKQAEEIAGLNKRRSSIKILNREALK